MEEALLTRETLSPHHAYILRPLYAIDGFPPEMHKATPSADIYARKIEAASANIIKRRRDVVYVDL